MFRFISLALLVLSLFHCTYGHVISDGTVPSDSHRLPSKNVRRGYTKELEMNKVGTVFNDNQITARGVNGCLVVFLFGTKAAVKEDKAKGIKAMQASPFITAMHSQAGPDVLEPLITQAVNEAALLAKGGGSVQNVKIWMAQSSDKPNESDLEDEKIAKDTIFEKFPQLKREDKHKATWYKLDAEGASYDYTASHNKFKVSRVKKRSGKKSS